MVLTGDERFFSGTNFLVFTSLLLENLLQTNVLHVKFNFAYAILEEDDHADAIGTRLYDGHQSAVVGTFHILSVDR